MWEARVNILDSKSRLYAIKCRMDERYLDISHFPSAWCTDVLEETKKVRILSR